MHVCDSFGLGDAMRGEDQRSEGFFSYVPLERVFRPIIRCARSVR